MTTVGKELAKIIRIEVGSPKMGCEVGVWKGFTSRTLLHKFNELSLLMVDRWERYDVGGRGAVSRQAKFQDLMDNAMRKAKEQTEFAKDRRTMIVSDSVEASHSISDSSLDFVFIDADHSYDAVKRDLQAYYGKVKVDGLFCGHDYETKNRWGVKRAVDEFAEENGLDFNLPTNRHTIWWLRKKVDGRK